jgi:hypothetical protein
MLRTWSTILYGIGFASLVLAAIGIVVWAVDVDGVLRTWRC